MDRFDGAGCGRERHVQAPGTVYRQAKLVIHNGVVSGLVKERVSAFSKLGLGVATGGSLVSKRRKGSSSFSSNKSRKNSNSSGESSKLGKQFKKCSGGRGQHQNSNLKPNLKLDFRKGSSSDGKGRRKFVQERLDKYLRRNDEESACKQPGPSGQQQLHTQADQLEEM